MIDDDEAPNDDWMDEEDGELTPQEQRVADRMGRLATRYPTFLLLMKVVQRHRRLQRLRKIDAPEQVVETDEHLREKALDELCDALPHDPDNNVFSLPSIIATLATELAQPYPSGDADA